VANNKDLYPFGPPRVLKIDGEYPTVSFPDLYTVRYHWNRPNPYFLPALAGGTTAVHLPPEPLPEAVPPPLYRRHYTGKKSQDSRHP